MKVYQEGRYDSSKPVALPNEQSSKCIRRAYAGIGSDGFWVP